MGARQALALSRWALGRLSRRADGRSAGSRAGPMGARQALAPGRWALGRLSRRADGRSAGSRAESATLTRVRLVIARCSVDYVGRLTAHLPAAVRLVMVKADGS